MQLKRGDTRTLNVTNLRLSDGTAATFQVGDILRFTLKGQYTDPDSVLLLQKTSDDGSITFTAGQSTATVLIKASDWANVVVSRTADCVADLELTRPGSPNQVTTLWSDIVPVLPDVTLTPHS